MQNNFFKINMHHRELFPRFLESSYVSNSMVNLLLALRLSCVEIDSTGGALVVDKKESRAHVVAVGAHPDVPSLLQVL